MGKYSKILRRNLCPRKFPPISREIRLRAPAGHFPENWGKSARAEFKFLRSTVLPRISANWHGARRQSVRFTAFLRL